MFSRMEHSHLIEIDGVRCEEDSRVVRGTEEEEERGRVGKKSYEGGSDLKASKELSVSDEAAAEQTSSFHRLQRRLKDFCRTLQREFFRDTRYR
jgi:hypothetical protein